MKEIFQEKLNEICLSEEGAQLSFKYFLYFIRYFEIFAYMSDQLTGVDPGINGPGIISPGEHLTC